MAETTMEINKENGPEQRTLEDVNEMLTLAKMTENEILPSSQTLFFAETNLYNHNYRLVEVDKHLLETISEGQTLYFRGEDEESIVLCTESKTYNVLGAETSNSLLVVDNCKFHEDIKEVNNRNLNKVVVQGIFYEYLEPVLAKAHLKKLNHLLENGLYKGPEYEYEISQDDLYSYNNLQDLVQSSKNELDAALKELGVVVINGKVRLLEMEYHFRILSYMLKLIDENSWPLDEINYEITMTSLIDLAPKEVINSLFDFYAEESKIIDSDQLYRYNETKVCRFFAQILLQTAGRFGLSEFLQAWSESVPEGMVPTEDMLHGIALIDLKSNPKSVRHFPEEYLPDDINERFRHLFDAKEKWSVPEITPYIQRLTTDKLNANALLAKYARASTVGGVKYYSAKHAK